MIELPDLKALLKEMRHRDPRQLAELKEAVARINAEFLAGRAALEAQHMPSINALETEIVDLRQKRAELPQKVRAAILQYDATTLQQHKLDLDRLRISRKDKAVEAARLKVKFEEELDQLRTIRKIHITVIEFELERRLAWNDVLRQEILTTRDGTSVGEEKTGARLAQEALRGAEQAAIDAVNDAVQAHS